MSVDSTYVNRSSSVLDKNKNWSLLWCKSVENKVPCKYGDDCRFVHHESQIPQRLELAKLKREAQTRKGRGVCHKFAEEGKCPYGNSCRFAHVTGDEKLAVEKKIEKRRAKRSVSEKALEQESKTHNNVNVEGHQIETEEDSISDENFEQWISNKIRNCNLYSLYPDIFEEGIAVIMKWRSRFADRQDIWHRFIKGKSGNTIRILKEFCESVPVIDSVRRSLSALESEEKIGIFQGGKVTILDLCSGFGFLSMFLSEMLPADRVNRIILVDIQWSRKVLEKDIEYGRELEKKKLGLVDVEEVISAASQTAEEQVVEGGSEVQDDKGKYISADHITGLFYETWPIPLVASKQNLKSSSTLRSMQKVVIDRALREGDLMILGIHLCGTLSMRAIDMFNRNANRVRFFALKPCCLPGIVHAKKNESFSIGGHIFSAKDVCASGKFVPTSRNKGGWDGPPRKHLENRFLSWTKNLALGINLPVENEEFMWKEWNMESFCGKLDDMCCVNQVNSSDDSTSRSVEAIYNKIGINCKEGDCNDKIAWWKIVQHIPLQESGYQNKYIWVQRQLAQYSVIPPLELSELSV